MGTSLKISPLAKQDLAQIVSYLAAQNEGAARRFYKAVVQKFSLLFAQPEMGSRRAELGQRIRSLPLKKYIIFSNLPRVES